MRRTATDRKRPIGKASPIRRREQSLRRAVRGAHRRRGEGASGLSAHPRRPRLRPPARRHTPRGNPLLDPPRYEPDPSSAPTAADLRLRTDEACEVSRRVMGWVPLTACLDTGNAGCTLMHRRAAIRAGLCDGFGRPTGGARGSVEVRGVVEGAAERIPRTTIAYRIKGKVMVVEAGITTEAMGCDLLVARSDIAEFERGRVHAHRQVSEDGRRTGAGETRCDVLRSGDDTVIIMLPRGSFGSGSSRFERAPPRSFISHVWAPSVLGRRPAPRAPPIRRRALRRPRPPGDLLSRGNAYASMCDAGVAAARRRRRLPEPSALG